MNSHPSIHFVAFMFLIVGARAVAAFAQEPGVAKEERLKDPNVIAGLIKQLSDENITTRDAAMRELMKAGREAFPPLRDAEANGNKELKQRIRTILDEIEWPVMEAAVKKIEKLGAHVGGGDPKRPAAITLRWFKNAGVKIRDEDVECLEDLPYLRRADLRRTEIGDKTCARLGKLPLLEDILVSDTNVSDVGLSEFRYLSRLKQLEAAGTKITGKGVGALADIKTLRSFSALETNVDDDGVAEIAKCRNLTGLGVSGPLGDSAINDLKKLRLNRLDLVHTKVTDNGMVDLRDQPLTALVLRSTAITDAGLAEIVPIKTLTVLDVEGTKITPEGLKQISQLPNIKMVFCFGLGVTEDDAQELFKQIPTLARVVYADKVGGPINYPEKGIRRNNER